MQGLKVSLPGFDVKDASPEQLAIDSDFDTFKIDATANPPHFGNVEVTFNTNPPVDVVTTLFSFPHNYGHRPSLMTHIDTGAAFVGSTVSGHVHLDVFDLSWIECVVTDTEFKIQILIHGSVDVTGLVMNFRYYIFAEDGK